MNIYEATIEDLKPYEATLDRYRRDATDHNPDQTLINKIVDAYVRLGNPIPGNCATCMGAAVSWVSNWYFNNK
jgi:hypothetical protein